MWTLLLVQLLMLTRLHWQWSFVQNVSSVWLSTIEDSFSEYVYWELRFSSQEYLFRATMYWSTGLFWDAKCYCRDFTALLMPFVFDQFLLQAGLLHYGWSGKSKSTIRAYFSGLKHTQLYCNKLLPMSRNWRKQSLQWTQIVPSSIIWST